MNKKILIIIIVLILIIISYFVFFTGTNTSKNTKTTTKTIPKEVQLEINNLIKQQQFENKFKLKNGDCGFTNEMAKGNPIMLDNFSFVLPNGYKLLPNTDKNALFKLQNKDNIIKVKLANQKDFDYEMWEYMHDNNIFVVRKQKTLNGIVYCYQKDTNPQIKLISNYKDKNIVFETDTNTKSVFDAINTVLITLR